MPIQRVSQFSTRREDTSNWKCKSCGCSDYLPCLPNGCDWVAKNLCSSCAEAVDLTNETFNQLKVVFDDLISKGQKLKNGALIETVDDVITFLLDNANIP